MKILMAHNHYQQRGGEDESTEMEAAMLVSQGHEVVRLTEHNERIDRMSPLSVAARTIWSRESYRRTREAIREHRPDVLHVQNFFPLLSPSIHYAARAEGVPVVQTLRNYRLLCPNALFFRDGSPCEDCLTSSLQLPAIRHRCYRGSRAGSAVVAGMNAVHRTLGTWDRNVDVFVALSQFVKRKFVEAGWDADRIVVKPNFVYPDPGAGDGAGRFALFAGRLSPEKGLQTVFDAWKQLAGKIPLKIVGDGPMASLVQTAARTIPGVEWLGRLPLIELYELMGLASVVVFPSEVYETFGRIAIEAFAKGTPVVVADIGAIAELVRDGETGFCFRPGDSAHLAAAVRRVIDHPRPHELRAAARREYLTRYTAAPNASQLLGIYQRALGHQPNPPGVPDLPRRGAELTA